MQLDPFFQNTATWSAFLERDQLTNLNVLKTIQNVEENFRPNSIMWDNAILCF